MVDLAIWPHQSNVNFMVFYCHGSPNYKVIKIFIIFLLLSWAWRDPIEWFLNGINMKLLCGSPHDNRKWTCEPIITGKHWGWTTCKEQWIKIKSRVYDGMCMKALIFSLPFLFSEAYSPVRCLLHDLSYVMILMLFYCSRRKNQ